MVNTIFLFLLLFILITNNFQAGSANGVLTRTLIKWMYDDLAAIPTQHSHFKVAKIFRFLMDKRQGRMRCSARACSLAPKR